MEQKRTLKPGPRFRYSGFFFDGTGKPEKETFRYLSDYEMSLTSIFLQRIDYLFIIP